MDSSINEKIEQTRREIDKNKILLFPCDTVMKVYGAIWRLKYITTLNLIHPPLPLLISDHLPHAIRLCLSGGWYSKCTSRINAMQSWPQRPAWDCGYCGYCTQPAVSGVSVYLMMMDFWPAMPIQLSDIVAGNVLLFVSDILIQLIFYSCS